MAQLVETIEKSLKKVADFLEITSVENEAHTSPPRHASATFAPRGHARQVLTGKHEEYGWEYYEAHKREAYHKEHFKEVRPRKPFDWRSDK